MADSKDILGMENYEEKPSVPVGLENAESKDIIDFLFANTLHATLF